jgi:hypothetical protein
VEFGKQPVEVQGFGKFTEHSRGIYGIYLELIKITTCIILFRFITIFCETNVVCIQIHICGEYPGILCRIFLVPHT